MTVLPIIVIPGIQGRSEWIAPAIQAIDTGAAGRRRVLTFSLGSGADATFEAWNRRIDALIADTGSPRAVVVGVSFGGIVAAHYAALAPSRTAALIVVSSPSPRWQLPERLANAVGRPWLAAPAIAVRSARALWPEIREATSSRAAAWRFAGGYLRRAVRYPIDPAAMAGYAARWMAIDVAGECARITAPTLVITGEPALDRIVPVSSTRDYLTLIPHATHATLPCTGHIGLVTRPAEFAALVLEFADRLK